ncbi:MAG: hypothetical protein AAFQ53_17185, partial [Bacteroidota bacterium]
VIDGLAEFLMTVTAVAVLVLTIFSTAFADKGKDLASNALEVSKEARDLARDSLDLQRAYGESERPRLSLMIRMDKVQRLADGGRRRVQDTRIHFRALNLRDSTVAVEAIEFEGAEGSWNRISLGTFEPIAPGRASAQDIGRIAAPEVPKRFGELAGAATGQWRVVDTKGHVHDEGEPQADKVREFLRGSFDELGHPATP